MQQHPNIYYMRSFEIYIIRGGFHKLQAEVMFYALKLIRGGFRRFPAELTFQGDITLDTCEMTNRVHLCNKITF